MSHGAGSSLTLSCIKTAAPTKRLLLGSDVHNSFAVLERYGSSHRTRQLCDAFNNGLGILGTRRKREAALGSVQTEAEWLAGRGRSAAIRAGC